MTDQISETSLSEFCEFLSGQIGLNFSGNRRSDLLKAMHTVSKESGFNDVESCIRSLMSSRLSRKQVEILSSCLTVGETYFLREKQSFDILEREILPRLTASRQTNRRRIRIWSAGCATGEEPYSIAISLSRVIPNLNDWNITILATDINPQFISKAEQGVYTKWSFRGTSPDFRRKYFTETAKDQYRIHSRFREMVNFSYLNLSDDIYPSLDNNTNAMDIIFCRNVLMYFTPERWNSVTGSFYNSLVEGGWLIVSPTEVSNMLYQRYAHVRFPGMTLYHKDSAKAIAKAPYLPTISVEPKSKLPDFFIPALKPKALERKPPAPQKVHHPSPVKKPEDVYNDALTLYDQGRYLETVEILVTLLANKTSNPKGIPLDGEIIALITRAYANQGRLAEALEWCEKGIAGDKLIPGLHYLQATILQEQGKIDEAKISLKKALYINPDFMLAHFTLGNIARQEGKWKESEKHFRNAKTLLSARPQDEILPESEGMTAGRLSEIVNTMNKKEK